MSRFLFVTWWGGGNQNPLLALGARLVERDHAVRVLGPAMLSPEFGAFERTITAAPLPTADDVQHALAEWPADGAVIDYMATDALCGAERAGVPTAALVHTLYRALIADGELPTMGMAGSLTRVNQRRETLGLPPVRRLAELLDSAAAVLVATVPEIDAPSDHPLPANVRYVGPLVEDPGPDALWSSPWPADDERPLVVVSLGTTPMGEEAALQRVLDAVARLPVRAFVTLGSHLDPGALRFPGNAFAGRYVRHSALLPAARLLVTHAGFGSVSAALLAGVPMLCLPHGREQPANAARVAALGAGRVLQPDAAPAQIAEAIGEVLTDPARRTAARHIGQRLAAVARDDPAIHRLEVMLRQPSPDPSR